MHIIVIRGLDCGSDLVDRAAGVLVAIEAVLSLPVSRTVSGQTSSYDH